MPPASRIPYERQHRIEKYIHIQRIEETKEGERDKQDERKRVLRVKINERMRADKKERS